MCLCRDICGYVGLYSVVCAYSGLRLAMHGYLGFCMPI